MDKITILGTGTAQLQIDRMASSVLIQKGDLNLVYDFGRGITHRLTQLGFKHDDIKHIFISHFHPDHSTDLLPFFQAANSSKIDPRTEALHIYGPVGIEELYKRMTELYSISEVDAGRYPIYIHTIKPGITQIEGLEVEIAKLQPADNHAIKFKLNNKIIALTGDSGYHEEEIAFLKNVDLAVIDAGHISKQQIVDLAIKTQAGKIICSHLYYELNQKEINQIAKDGGYKGTTIVGKDLMEFTF